MWTVLFFLAVLWAFPIQAAWGETAPAGQQAKQLIYDDAGLLSPAEYDELNRMANQYGAQRETDIIIVTSNNTANKDVMKMTEDFYDEHAPGYDKPHGNAVILTVDMKHREIYLAGFYKGETYLDDSRLNKIRTRMSPKLTSGSYKEAFQTYIQTAYRYMGFRPGVNPDNLLFTTWFPLLISVGIGGIVVGMMAYRSGGRVTVNRQTYEDSGSSEVLEAGDRYLHTTTTKQKIEKSKSGGSGGGGGGRTGGGHSHSGSRGSF